jgi:hypothetical protein
MIVMAHHGRTLFRNTGSQTTFLWSRGRCGVRQKNPETPTIEKADHAIMKTDDGGPRPVLGFLGLASPCSRVGRWLPLVGHGSEAGSS